MKLLAALLVPAFAACLISLTACKKEPAPTGPGSGGPTGSGHQPSAPAGHDHDHADHDHDHEHADGHDDHGEGEAVSLGSIKVGAWDVQVSRHGDIVAGKEAHLDIAVTGAPAPAAVRVWIGAQDARGSLKAKAEGGENGSYHVHVEAPATLADDAQLWIECEDAAGAKTAASLPLKKEEPSPPHGPEAQAGASARLPLSRSRRRSSPGGVFMRGWHRPPAGAARRRTRHGTHASKRPR